MNPKIIYLTLSLLFTSIILFGQEESKAEEDRTYVISYVPQYIFINGLRMDLEKTRIQNSRHSLILSPQFYYNDRRNSGFTGYENDRSYNSLQGFGLDVTHKIFLKNEPASEGAYFAYGISGQRFKLEYDTYELVEVEKDGNTTYTYEGTAGKHEITKMGLNQMIGYQFTPADYLMLDFFGGLGFRYSNITSKTPDARNYSGYIWDYGYSGITVLLGVRAGVLLF